MILPPDYEARVVDSARRFTDDIAECAEANISIVFIGQAPALRFVFGDPRLRGRPSLTIQLVAQSRKNPFAPGRLVEEKDLQKHVREWVETYFKFNGIEITRKAIQHASL